MQSTALILLLQASLFALLLLILLSSLELRYDRDLVELLLVPYLLIH